MVDQEIQFEFVIDGTGSGVSSGRQLAIHLTINNFLPFSSSKISTTIISRNAGEIAEIERSNSSGVRFLQN